ncbi:MAG: type II secretion system protein [Candidatus Levyibacteriota bacterium]
MKKILISSKGYTLIELLAVIIIISVVGLVIGAIIISAFRGTNKTSAINEIRQEGNNRLSELSKMVEFAQSFDGVSLDGTDYASDCVSQNPEVPLHYKYIKVSDFNNGQLTISCSTDPETNSPTIASNGASLVVLDSIAVSDCYFTCTQNYLAEPPIIGIYFTFEKVAGADVSDQNYAISFETNVVMRNIGK